MTGVQTCALPIYVPIVSYNYYADKSSYPITFSINLLDGCRFKMIYQNRIVEYNVILRLREYFVDTVSNIIKSPDLPIVLKEQENRAMLDDLFFNFE